MVGIICTPVIFADRIENLLRMLTHRGAETYIEILKTKESAPDYVLGLCQSSDRETIVEIDKRLVILDSLFDISKKDIRQIIKVLYWPSEDTSILKEFQGIVILAVDKAGLTIWRSIDGQKAVYLGEGPAGISVATEKKSLWEIGCDYIHPVNPGSIQRICSNKAEVTKQQEIASKSWSSGEEDAIKILGTYLGESVRHLTGRKCGILFSGGVDSSLLAYIVGQVSEDVLLYSASYEKSRDRTHTRHAADILGLERISVPMNPERVWQVLPEVIYRIETTNRMDVEIALPFFLCAQEASERDTEYLVSGQGPDEQFAGYARHIPLFASQGEHALETELRKEVDITHEANISRDERASVNPNLKVCFPYLHPKFAELALSLPARWKIHPGSSPERKVIFRKLAEHLGLAHELTLEPKKATQFSSGASKVIARAIKENNGCFNDLTANEFDAKVQVVLDLIGKRIGLPVVAQEDLDIEYRFVEELKHRNGI